jgi:tRNA (mo5U34)-methyltransferase
MDADELRRRVDEIRWFHRIDLGDGIVTPGEDDSARKLRRLRLPERLDGQTVLDVGPFDGFFSFEAERRGASRVVAVDPACWPPPAWGPNGWGTQVGFLLARRALGSSVEDIDVDLLDIPPETVGTFDVVLFLGLFNHLRDPWHVLSSAASVYRRLMVVETHADLLDWPPPAMASYPGAEVDGDPSNYWGPNAAAIAGMLRLERFRRVRVFKERRAYRLARSGVRRLTGRPYARQQGRLVAHAFR